MFMTEKIESPMVDLRKRAKQEDPASIVAALVALFPELRKARGVSPWQSEVFEQWTQKQGEDARATARFILTVWGGTGAFALSDLRDISPESRALIAAWVSHPFWL